MDWAITDAPDSFALSFGRHKGRRLAEIGREDPAYLEWLAEKATEREVRRAAQNIILTDPEIDHYRLAFGKHNDKTLEEVAALEPDYLDWLGKNAKNYALRARAIIVRGRQEEAAPR